MSDPNLEEIYNYRHLTDRLATAGQPSEAQLAAVARAGFDVVINLALPTSDNALPDERGTVEALGMAYVAIPVIWEHPTRQDFQAFLRVMDRHRDEQVFVHCAANMRVSVFVALWRITQQGWDVRDAMADVLPIWQPNETWQAFMNDVLTGGD